jgi:hypothetical protein
MVGEGSAIVTGADRMSGVYIESDTLMRSTAWPITWKALMAAGGCSRPFARMDWKSLSKLAKPRGPPDAMQSFFETVLRQPHLAWNQDLRSRT